MSKTYVQINSSQMGELLEPQGFVLIKVPKTRELVWGKRVDVDGLPLTLRVYSSIEPEGASRECGKDAVRVQLLWRDGDGSIRKVGTSKRVNRVDGWEDRLQGRIDKWVLMLGPKCRRCDSPMVRRIVKKADKQSSEFWGCASYPRCRCTEAIAGAEN